MEKKKITIEIPEEWLPKVRKLMNDMGFSSYGELFRYLLRKALVKKGLLQGVEI